MTGNKYLLIVALIGITIYSIPSTTSIFQGQHTFYNTTQIPCEKCHQDIVDILNLPATPQKHTGIGCKNCHTRDGNASHSASIISCKSCHTSETHDKGYSCILCHGSHGSTDAEIAHRNAVTVLQCLDCHQIHR